MNFTARRSNPRSRTRWRRSIFTLPASPAIQAYGVPSGSSAARTASSSASFPSAGRSSAASQVMSASAKVGRSWRSAAWATDRKTLAWVPGESQARMPATAGSAVSSPVSRIQSVPGGGRKSTPPLSSTAGPRTTTRSPGTADAAQREAGPPAAAPGASAPCSAKSTSISAGSWRCSRMVYERISGRSAGSWARQAGYQFSLWSAKTGSDWWACGRNSLKRWSRPPEAISSSRSPPKVIRTMEGPSRRVRRTRTSKKRNGVVAGAAVVVMRRNLPEP